MSNQDRFETLVEVGKYTRPNGEEARGTVIRREDGAIFANIHPWFYGTQLGRMLPSRKGMGALDPEEFKDYSALLKKVLTATRKVLKDIIKTPEEEGE